MWWTILLLVVLAVVSLVFIWWKQRSRRLTGGARRRVQSAWSHVETLSDPMHKIMEADKVFDMALKELGYTGSLGEKLKMAGPRISNLQAVWDAHKLRNRLAHETGMRIGEQEADRAIRVFEKAIRDLS